MSNRSFKTLEIATASVEGVRRGGAKTICCWLLPRCVGAVAGFFGALFVLVNQSNFVRVTKKVSAFYHWRVMQRYSSSVLSKTIF